MSQTYHYQVEIYSLTHSIPLFTCSLNLGPDDLYYKKNQTPHDVDYIGQRHVIDQCVASSVNHVVLLGNMGGYRSKLNEINKWKRAAERYLMKRVLFTIIHSGALTDEPGNSFIPCSLTCLLTFNDQVVGEKLFGILMTPYCERILKKFLVKI